MKKLPLLLVLLLIASPAAADLILLKNGTVIEGKVVQVRGIFVRVLDNYDTPFREFLIEDIVNIEQSSPDDVSQLTIRNIHQRALNKAQGGKIQQAVDKKASELLEEAIQKSEAANLESVSAGVKIIAEEKASAIIGEAVKVAQTPRLDQVDSEVKTIAEEKAGNVIEQAVKTVEVFPLQKAPNRVQVAAKQAASTLVGEAVNETSQRTKAFSILGFTVKDLFFAGLIILLIMMLYKEKQKSDPVQPAPEPEQKPVTPSLRAIDENVRNNDFVPVPEEAADEGEDSWDEKRDHRRFEWNFPISLSLDENNPIFAMVKNVSRSGAYAICNDVNLLRAMGDESRFKFNFASKDPNFPINGKAEVVRIRSNRGLGLKFFDLNQESTGYLEKLALSA